MNIMFRRSSQWECALLPHCQAIHTLFCFNFSFFLRFRKMQRFHGSPFWHQFRCGELCLATCPQTGDYTPFSSACQCSFLISYTSIYKRYANLKGKKVISRWCGLIVWPLNFMFERLRSNFTSVWKSVVLNISFGPERENRLFSLGPD